MADETDQEKKERISNEEIMETVAKAEELIEKISDSFLSAVTSNLKSPAKRKVITRLFKTGVRALGIIETIWAMVLPLAIAAWNVMIFRTFFNTIPHSLKESAFIDGASHFRILFTIIWPLSKPLLATFTLFTVVRFWNDWFQAVLFLRDQKKYPIQLFLRSLVVNLDHYLWQTLVDEGKQDVISTRQLKAAAVMITITPILCFYPFLQKYFAKGILIGSIKG